MIRKTVCLTVLIMLLGLTTNAFAGWALWQGNVSSDYTDAANWVDQAGAPLGRVPHFNTDMVGIGSFKTNYWPVLPSNPDPALLDFSATNQLFCMSEWHGVYSSYTIDGGYQFFAADQYMLIGRHSDDTSDFVVNSGGIGQVISGTLYGPTRWLRVGRGDSTGGGVATMVMNGGTIYAQAMSVGNPDGTGEAGSSATINDGAELLVGGEDYFDASFDIAANASMTINPGGYVRLDATELQDGSRVAAMGALNLVADGSGSATLIVPWYIADVAGLLDYFGYDDGGGGTTPGNVNAIWNGGTGQFVLSYPGGLYTEVTVIPEPVTIALLGIGGLCLLRRKRN